MLSITANFPLFNLRFHPYESRTRVSRLRAMKMAYLEFPVLVKRTSQRCLGVGGDAEFELESKVLEFMESSKNPDKFPSKEDLMDSGRFDLVDGILRIGGWLCLGWDFDDEDDQQFGRDGDHEFHCLSLSVSSSGRSLEMPEEDSSGIEGILNRLERERSISFGLRMEENALISNSKSKGDWLAGTSKNGTDAGLKRSSKPALSGQDYAKTNESEHKLSKSKSLPKYHGSTHSNKPDTWRSWSRQRTGMSNMEFEAAEFSVHETKIRGSMETSRDNSQVDNSDPFYGQGESNSFTQQGNLCQIESRLQHLKSELSSVLCTLRSSNTVVMPMDEGGPAEESRQLSDDYEFQENDIMNARDRLRSICAKLAVVEGQMALAIIYAQKTVEYKQKKIDEAHKAFRLLRSVFIVWASSALEVLVVGSFDGWATQRKMEKSETGIFSLHLKLYPGKYEIKFVFDGEWRIDPLRPIVDSGGYENNLLIVT